MRILRIVTDYYPAVGGNERWNLQFDRWFSNVAGDDVQVVVMRQERVFKMGGYRDLLADWNFEGTFEVPRAPKVRAYQAVVPSVRGLALVRAYRQLLAPWIDRDYDVVVSQLFGFHTYPLWFGKPFVLEPGSVMFCSYQRLLHDSCQRTARGCRLCYRERGGMGWWVRDRLNQMTLDRFDMVSVAHMETGIKDLALAGFASKGYLLRHIIDPEQLRYEPESDRTRWQSSAVKDHISKHKIVVMQYCRLVDTKNPSLVLDVAEHMPECGFVFGGDGPERASLEERVRTTPSLRNRVLFLGAVEADCIGVVAKGVSAFLLTCLDGNASTGLYELMSLAIAPAVALDIDNFPPEFQERELVLKVPNDPVSIAAQIRVVVRDKDRCDRIVEAAAAYAREVHSPTRMWKYRALLAELAERRRS